VNIELPGTVSIVTGASRGIGAAIAGELAAAGSAIALFDVEASLARETAAQIAARHGVATRAYGVDVRDAAAVADAVDNVLRDLGALDHLINNAGIQHVSPIGEFPLERWEAVRAVDLDGVFYATRAVWPHFAARGRGRIVNIASALGLVALPYKAAYVAAKHAVVGLTKTAALEGAEKGITVNAICPGAVLTDLVRNQAPDLAASYGVPEEEALRRGFLDAMPTRRFVEPEEVAQLCVYLCSDAARSITGAALAIDGGWAAR
jgi:3-hydroxybutyrate dehydrogenase